jgi:ribose transport system substrate-binding protein
MRLAVFTKNTTNPAYAAARIGAERTAARHGARVVHYVPRKADDVDEQIALIAEARAAGHDAFVFVPVHTTRVDEAIGRVLEDGIPVVNYLNRLARGAFVSFVGADDVQIGRKIAAYLARRLEGRGRIVLLEGMPGSATNVDRMRGFAAALQAWPDIRVVATLQGEYQQVVGRAAMEAFLAAAPGAFDAVLAANDAMALGAIESLQSHGLRPFVTGVNALPDAIAAVKAGTLLATADFDALRIACVATEAAIRHLRGESVPREIMLPVQIVDRSNYTPWDKPLDERECPRWADVVK